MANSVDGEERTNPPMPAEMTKGRSPFYPGQPVPAEFFVGREKQASRIMRRGVAQVAEGLALTRISYMAGTGTGEFCQAAGVPLR